MSKFKVGDRVKQTFYSSLSDEIGTIIDKSPNGKTNWLIKGFSSGNIVGNLRSFSEEYLILATEPLTNTIITNITSPEQHKRVQEKLFETGCEWINSGRKIVLESCEYITVDENQKMYNQNLRRINYKNVSASSFLGEDEDHEEMTKCLEKLIKYNSVLPDFSNKVEPQRPPLMVFDEAANVDWGKIFSGAFKTTYTNKNIIKKSMNNIVTFAKDLLLSADEKLLRKYGPKR